MLLYQKSTIAEDTVERITEMIRAGEYAPGDRLPGERQLAELLGVGRTSVREAIRRLETMGLVESRHGLGTFVKEPSHEVMQAALIPHLISNPLTIEKLFEIRQIIEVEAAERAAQRIDAAQLATMKQWVEAVETCIARGDVRGMAVADVEFHRQIISATGNDILTKLVDSIVDLLREMRYDSLKIPELFPEIISDHRAILAALEAGDSQAARLAVKTHLDGLSSRVKAFWVNNS